MQINNDFIILIYSCGEGSKEIACVRGDGNVVGGGGGEDEVVVVVVAVGLEVVGLEQLWKKRQTVNIANKILENHSNSNLCISIPNFGRLNPCHRRKKLEYRFKV